MRKIIKLVVGLIIIFGMLQIRQNSDDKPVMYENLIQLQSAAMNSDIISRVKDAASSYISPFLDLHPDIDGGLRILSVHVQKLYKFCKGTLTALITDETLMEVPRITTV